MSACCTAPSVLCSWAKGSGQRADIALAEEIPVDAFRAEDGLMMRFLNKLSVRAQARHQLMLAIGLQ